MNPQNTPSSGNITGSDWICACGKNNNGNFCVACGRPRPAANIEPQASADEKSTAPVHSASAKTARQEPKPPTSADKADKWKPALLGAGFALLLAVSFFVAKNINSSSPSPTQPSEKTAPAKIRHADASVANASHQSIESELGLGEIELGDKPRKVQELFGQAKATETKGKETHHHYDTLDVVTINGQVHSLISESPALATKRGIHVGSSLQDVIAAYGDSQMKSSIENLDLYEYGFSSKHNDYGLLRFAINQSTGKVDYISIRIPDSFAGNKSEERPDAASQKAPIQVLHDFHRNITNHRYRQAYSSLSKKIQSEMTYDGWVAGFQTTVQSSVTNIRVISQTQNEVQLTYILKAVDNPGGTSFFKGSAVLIKTPVGWKIDDITNKTL